MSKKPIADGNARARIAEFLPNAFTKAFQSYHDFMQLDVPTVAKEFSAHHTAAKVAVAHIELLIELAEWAHLPHDDAGENHELATMIEQAGAELAEHKYLLLEDADFDDEG